ncbi:MAG: hypothetical protein QHH04_02485 [Methanolinea sp.]|nr:hypothetical protein [Methanolinea sp.]
MRRSAWYVPWRKASHALPGVLFVSGVRTGDLAAEVPLHLPEVPR